MILKEKSQDLYKGMLRIRRVEEEIANRYHEQEMRCPMHLCIGQEAIAIGVTAALGIGDKVFSNHRAHGHYLAKGGSLVEMIAELYGRSNGCCGGRGGSMHLIDLSVGFMGATPIVGGTVPLAVGAAWASVLQSTGEIVVVFFGDGCFEEGVIHESMNFAALHKLPIVFVCENNNFSVYTSLNERQPSRPIYKIAAAHGLYASAGDGNAVESVYEEARAACDRARQGAGPQFLEFSVYRWREHCGPNFDDILNYRNKSVIAEGIASCPVSAYANSLKLRGYADTALLESWDHDITLEIRTAFEQALASAIPMTSAAGTKVYA